LEQRRFRDLASAEGGKRFTGTSRWQQLPVMEVDGHGLQVGAILHGSFDLCWKASLVTCLALWTGDGFHLMLLNLQADFWQIQDLTAFGDRACHGAEVLSTLLTDRGGVTDHLIRVLYHHESLSAVSWLASWSFFARTARTPWLAGKPVGRWGLTTRSTVLCQSVFEFLDPGIRLSQLLFQWEQFCYQRFEESIFFSKGLEFFVFCHASTLVAFLFFGKSGGDLSSYILEKKKRGECNSPVSRFLSQYGSK
jgi:hypothetical protein